MLCISLQTSIDRIFTHVCLGILDIWEYLTYTPCSSNQPALKPTSFRQPKNSPPTIHSLTSIDLSTQFNHRSRPPRLRVLFGTEESRLRRIAVLCRQFWTKIVCKTKRDLCTLRATTSLLLANVLSHELGRLVKVY